MKAKKLELRTGKGELNGQPRQELYLNGKMVEDNSYYYDERSKLIVSNEEFNLEDISKIFKCSMEDIPNKMQLGLFFRLLPAKYPFSLATIDRVGKKITFEYGISLYDIKSMTLWNSKTFALKLMKNLEKKGFIEHPRNGISMPDDDCPDFSVLIINKNITDIIGKAFNENCRELIQAIRLTESQMLKLAIAAGKKK